MSCIKTIEAPTQGLNEGRPVGHSVASTGPREQGRKEAAPPQPLRFLPSGLIFYDTKVTVMNRVLNATAQRTADHAAPEITLDPLEIVGGKTSYTDQNVQQQRLHSQTSELAHMEEPPGEGSPGLGASPHSRGFHRQAPRTHAESSALQAAGGRGRDPFLTSRPGHTHCRGGWDR